MVQSHMPAQLSAQPDMHFLPEVEVVELLLLEEELLVSDMLLQLLMPLQPNNLLMPPQLPNMHMLPQLLKLLMQPQHNSPVMPLQLSKYKVMPLQLLDTAVFLVMLLNHNFSQPELLFQLKFKEVVTVVPNSCQMLDKFKPLMLPQLPVMVLHPLVTVNVNLNY
jgi:hypothetical protein